MSKIKEANEILEKIRGKKFRERHLIKSEQDAELFIEDLESVLIGASKFLEED